MERTVLRIALLVMLFVLLSADYSSLVSTVFTALGGTVVVPDGARSSSASATAAGTGAGKVPTAPGAIGGTMRTTRRSSTSSSTASAAADLVRAEPNIVDDGEDEDDGDVPDVEDEFDLAAGASAKLFTAAGRSKLLATMRTSCLPKLICELHAAPHRQNLGESERSLLSLIRETSISTTAEVTSKYHFAAHMGQLIAGIDGTGCHNFYPACPFPGMQVLSMMKKVRIR